MRTTILIALCTLTVQFVTSDENTSQSVEVPETGEILRTESRRVARQLNFPNQDYVPRPSPTRQVIKIPSNARLKVVQAQQPPKPAVRKVQQQNNRQRPVTKQRPKRPFDDDDYYDSPEDFRLKKPVKKTRNGYTIQDVSPEEFYDENDDLEYFQKKSKKQAVSYQSQKKRHRKQKYDNTPQASHVERRPLYDEDTGYEFRRPRPHHNFYESYDDYQGASSVTMKQVAPPNLADGPKEENYPAETPVRKFPSSRHVQSVFPQQYTTHNSYVTRNFGLEDHHKRTGYHGDDERGHEEIDAQPMATEQRPMILPTPEQRPMLLPTGSSGIHIVKPPQFNGGPGPAGPSPNQRATIRDILLQDCSDAEALGYCASPPRYPTQQINNIMKKCADMVHAMYSPAPIDPEDDLSSFESRSDNDEDIEFVDPPMTSNSSKIMGEWSQWSRSSNEPSNTMCNSLLTQTEPGYAREVSTGRWFVILQTLDAVVQRVLTDTCERPGKPCGGLSGLKCSRSASFTGYKATRCVQRFTQQRLISWDPETPQVCPKVRVFRFPTACICHLSLD